MKIAETLTTVSEILWDGETVGDDVFQPQFICLAIGMVSEAKYGRTCVARTHAADVVAFLVNTYGMDVSGSWFSRKSDYTFTGRVDKLRQQRRHVFLKCAIKHAHKIGV